MDEVVEHNLGPFAFNPDAEVEKDDPYYTECLKKAKFCLIVGGYFNYDDMDVWEIAAFVEVHNEIVKEQNKNNKG